MRTAARGVPLALPDPGGKERFSFDGFSFYVEKQQDLPGVGGGFWLGEQRYAGTEELLFNKERTLAQEMELRRDIYGRRVLRFRTSIPTFDSADRMYDSYRELDILILEKHMEGIWHRGGYQRMETVLLGQIEGADARTQRILEACAG